MLTIEQSISRLKINLVRKRPFYGVILMKLNDMKESNTTNIMSTDGENIYYNKKYMEQLNEAERKGIQQGKREIAKALLDVLDIETIALKTGLSIDEINKLK